MSLGRSTPLDAAHLLSPLLSYPLRQSLPTRPKRHALERRPCRAARAASAPRRVRPHAVRRLLPPHFPTSSPNRLRAASRPLTLATLRRLSPRQLPSAGRTCNRRKACRICGSPTLRSWTIGWAHARQSRRRPSSFSIRRRYVGLEPTRYRARLPTPSLCQVLDQC